MLGLLNVTTIPKPTKLSPPHLFLVLELWPCKGHTEHILSLLHLAEVYLQEVLGQETIRVHLEPRRTCALSVSLCGFAMGPPVLAFHPPKEHYVSYFPIAMIKHHH